MTIVLIVDDEPTVRRGTARYLRARGYTVIETHCVAGARELLRSRKDIVGVVTDYDLGDGSGRDVLAEACAAGVTRRVLYSGNPNAERFNVDDVAVLKPWLPIVVDVLGAA